MLLAKARRSSEAAASPTLLLSDWVIIGLIASGSSGAKLTVVDVSPPSSPWVAANAADVEIYAGARLPIASRGLERRSSHARDLEVVH